MRALGSGPFLALLLWAGLACAQSAPPEAAEERDERARLHYRAGTSYYAEGAFEQALQEFEQAYRLSPRPGLLFNIASTLERMGQLERALEHFERYLPEVPAGEEHDLLERRLVSLRERVAAQRSSPPAPAAETVPASSGSSGFVLGGAVSLAIAGAAAIVWGIFGALALSAQSSIEGGCRMTSSCTPADVSDLRTFSLVADFGWPVAAAGGATGLVLLLLGAL